MYPCVQLLYANKIIKKYAKEKKIYRIIYLYYPSFSHVKV
jgi:hypothetical protein